MTGWRIGYVLAIENVISAMTKLQENIVACAPLPSQYAAIEALSGKENYSANMIDVFPKRRNLLVDGINAAKLLKCSPPEATSYLMVNISGTKMKSHDFAYDLLDKVHVAVVPGITYGESCVDFICIAFTLGEDKIHEGVNRIQKYTESLTI